MKTELLTSIFTEEQLKAIKLIITNGFWGDCDIEFGSGENTEVKYACGYYTNMGKDKSFSGFMSGVSKTIKKSGTKALTMCNDWWQDGSGDMMFFNMELLECNYNELEKWASE